MLEVTKTIVLPPVNEREALRYAQGGTDEKLRRRLLACAEGLEFTPRVIFRQIGKEEFFNALPSARESVALTNLLRGCDNVVVFAATVGIAFDYALMRRKNASLADAQLMQGLGAERIEALCDEFCKEYPNGTKRFSPGYGDFPLEAQRELFQILHPEKIGIGLTESLMMTPSKSVTALFGLL